MIPYLGNIGVQLPAAEKLLVFGGRCGTFWQSVKKKLFPPIFHRRNNAQEGEIQLLGRSKRQTEHMKF